MGFLLMSSMSHSQLRELAPCKEQNLTTIFYKWFAGLVVKHGRIAEAITSK
jgi:hypothetical protein